jgi:ABC-2 type transport system ATP-binding protein
MTRCEAIRRLAVKIIPEDHSDVVHKRLADGRLESAERIVFNWIRGKRKRREISRLRAFLWYLELSQITTPAAGAVARAISAARAIFIRMEVLEVRDLRKQYKETLAVAGVSFGVKKGEIVGLLGPNGAGKTTTINMVLGVLTPTSGSISIAGIDLATHRSLAAGKSNFAAVYAELPGNLTVYENLRFFGLLYDVRNVEARIKDLLAQFDLEKFKHTRVGVLSSGEHTRVSLAKALLNAPPLLLLDEPTASLDPSTARTVREHIRALADAGTAVLWTSHNMYEVTDVCDRVLFMSHGKVMLEGDPKTLPQEHGKTNLEELFITVAREPLSLEHV